MSTTLISELEDENVMFTTRYASYPAQYVERKIVCILNCIYLTLGLVGNIEQTAHIIRMSHHYVHLNPDH